jgi:hypothetical protein
METKELRLGNYVSNGENVMLVDCHTIYDNTEIFNGLKPIPLTSYWLVKFGFEENSTSFTNSIGFPCIVKLKKQSNYLFYDSIQIKHVHQLQNLYFALTDKELQINKIEY